MQIGVVPGSCKSVLVEGLTSSATTSTQRQLRATTTIDDNYDNDDTARRATFNAGHVDHSLFPVARHKDPVGEPKCRLSGPFQGASCLGVPASTRCTAGLLGGNCTYTHPRSAAYTEQAAPGGLHRATANPSDSSTTHSTEGTGAQFKTRGQGPGHDIDPCRFLHGATKF